MLSRLRRRQDGGKRNSETLAANLTSHENRTEGCTTQAMHHAAMHGHIEVAKWLHENRSDGCMTDTMDYATSCCYLEIVEWFLEVKPKILDDGRILIQM